MSEADGRNSHKNAKSDQAAEFPKQLLLKAKNQLNFRLAQRHTSYTGPNSEVDVPLVGSDQYLLIDPIVETFGSLF